MNPRILHVSFAILAASTCAHTKQLPLSDPQASDVAVYRAVLDSMFVQPGKNRITQLVIRDSTTVWRLETLVGDVSDALHKLPGVDNAAERDFEARNHEAHPLRALERLGLTTRVTLVPDQALSSLPRGNPENYWSEFYKRYPGSAGHTALSAIGYNASADVAILIVTHGCGSLCGSGDVVALRRTDRGWRITGRQNLWVS
jgi:hypothetical protein